MAENMFQTENNEVIYVLFRYNGPGSFGWHCNEIFALTIIPKDAVPDHGEQARFWFCD
jgi:hypothetical protein